MSENQTLMSLYKKQKILICLAIFLFSLPIDHAHTISKFLIEFGINEIFVYNFSKLMLYCSKLMLCSIAILIAVVNLMKIRKIIEIASDSSADKFPYPASTFALSLFHTALDIYLVMIIIKTV